MKSRNMLAAAVAAVATGASLYLMLAPATVPTVKISPVSGVSTNAVVAVKATNTLRPANWQKIGSITNGAPLEVPMTGAQRFFCGEIEGWFATLEWDYPSAAGPLRFHIANFGTNTGQFVDLPATQIRFLSRSRTNRLTVFAHNGTNGSVPSNLVTWTNRVGSPVQLAITR